MRIIDLSHPIHPTKPVYPGTAPPSIAATAALDKDGFEEHQITFTTHTGTHVDAPSHMLADAETLDRLPLAQATVSQHLKVLKEAGWISGVIEGTATCYQLDEINIEWFRSVVGEIF